jgi:hypothetical protein
MSGKTRAIAVAAATAGLIALWVPAAMASTTSTPLIGNATLINGPLVNSGAVNVNLGSNNTAIGNTCNNTNVSSPMTDNLLSWAVDVPQADCVMAGGPNHF